MSTTATVGEGTRSVFAFTPGIDLTGSTVRVYLVHTLAGKAVQVASFPGTAAGVETEYEVNAGAEGLRPDLIPYRLEYTATPAGGSAFQVREAEPTHITITDAASIPNPS